MIFYDESEKNDFFQCMKEGKKSGGVEKRGKSKGRESEGRAKEMDVLRKT